MTENAYRKVTEDELEYERRESRFRYQLQRNTELSVARNEGEAIGLKKGRTEGEAIGLKKGRSEGAVQKQREIAKNFKHAADSHCCHRREYRLDYRRNREPVDTQEWHEYLTTAIPVFCCTYSCKFAGSASDKCSAQDKGVIAARTTAPRPLATPRR